MQTNKQTDIQTNRDTNIHTDRQTDEREGGGSVCACERERDIYIYESK